MQKKNAFRRILLLVLCLCLLAGTVFADDPQPSERGHDYTLVAYEAPRYRAPGFERYRCTKCGDEYEIELPQLVERAPNWSYDSLSNATSDHLTIFVGYYGMSYTQKITLSLRDIVNNCYMVQQTFSCINRRPRICYLVGYGPLLDDVLAYAGVDIYSIQALQFGTTDSGDASGGGTGVSLLLQSPRLLLLTALAALLLLLLGSGLKYLQYRKQMK